MALLPSKYENPIESVPNSISGLVQERYGNMVILKFSVVAVNSGTVGSLSSAFPDITEYGIMRLTDSSNKYQMALVTVNSNGGISASYFIPNTTTASSSGCTGTLDGEIIYFTNN